MESRSSTAARGRAETLNSTSIDAAPIDFDDWLTALSRARQTGDKAGADAVLDLFDANAELAAEVLAQHFVDAKLGTDIGALRAAFDAMGARGANALRVELSRAPSDGVAVVLIAQLDRMRDSWLHHPMAHSICSDVVKVIGSRGSKAAAAALRLLARSGFAGTSVAAELADLAVTPPEQAKGVSRTDVLTALRALGGSAHGAAPTLASNMRSFAAADQLIALDVLRATGPSDDAVLDVLVDAAADADREVRAGAAVAIASWGEWARDAGPTLVRRLREEPDRHVSLRLALALRSAMNGASTTTWRKILAEFSTRDGGQPLPFESVRQVVMNVQAHAAMVDLLPALPEGLVSNVTVALVETSRTPDEQLFAFAFRSEVPVVRSCAVAAWGNGAFREEDLPRDALKLLNDVSARVRTSCALALAQRSAEFDARVLSIATAAISDEDAKTRWNVAQIFGLLGARRPGILPRCVDLLADREYHVRVAAVDALASSRSMTVSLSPRARAWLLEEAVDGRSSVSAEALVSVLQRAGDGLDSLKAVVTPVLRDSSRRPVDAIRRSLSIVIAGKGHLGCDLSHVASSDHPSIRFEVLAAKAVSSGDFGAFSRAADADARSLAFILEATPEGAHAVLSLVGRSQRRQIDADPNLWRRAAQRASTVVRSVAAHSGQELRLPLRMGAARIARGLDASSAVDVLGALAVDRERSVRVAALEELVALEEAAPGAVPLPLVRMLLSRCASRPELDPEFEHILHLVCQLGAQAKSLTSQLRQIDLSASGDRLAHLRAVAIWLSSDDAKLAVSSSREILAAVGVRGARRSAAHHSQANEASESLAWFRVSDVAVLLRQNLQAADVETIVAALRDPKWREAAWQLMRVLEAHGPSAVPALPMLREFLDDESSAAQEGHTSQPPPTTSRTARAILAAQVLSSMGTSAVPALPSLRRAIASGGAAESACRSAVSRMDSSPR